MSVNKRPHPNIGISKHNVSETNQVLPVFVVDDHNDVLPCLHRLMGSKRIPLQNLMLLHFDSHSDLSVPLGLEAGQIFKKDELYSIVSIENWIIPLVFAGHVSTVVWIKPFWTQESMKPNNQFDVGEIVESKKLGVTSTDNYFLSELSYFERDRMINTKQVDVHVVSLGSEILCDCKSRCNPPEDTSSSIIRDTDVDTSVVSLSDDGKLCEAAQGGPGSAVVPCAIESLPDPGLRLFCCETTGQHEHSALPRSPAGKRVRVDARSDADDHGDIKTATTVVGEALEKKDSAGFLLDIDLDFFSTADPFRSALNSEQRRLMSKLYRFTPPRDHSIESVRDCVQRRTEQLNYLQKIMTSMQCGTLPCFTDSSRDRLLSQLLCSIGTSSSESTSNAITLNRSFDYDWLHEIGTGIDDCPLPHHISSNADIQRLLMRVESLLKNLPRPCALTIARSTSDGYCPEHQVDDIQAAVIAMAERIYGTLDVKLRYVDS